MDFRGISSLQPFDQWVERQISEAARWWILPSKVRGTLGVLLNLPTYNLLAISVYYLLRCAGEGSLVHTTLTLRLGSTSRNKALYKLLGETHTHTVRASMRDDSTSFGVMPCSGTRFLRRSLCSASSSTQSGWLAGWLAMAAHNHMCSQRQTQSLTAR